MDTKKYIQDNILDNVSNNILVSIEKENDNKNKENDKENDKKKDKNKNPQNKNPQNKCLMCNGIGLIQRKIIKPCDCENIEKKCYKCEGIMVNGSYIECENCLGLGEIIWIINIK